MELRPCQAGTDRHLQPRPRTQFTLLRQNGAQGTGLIIHTLCSFTGCQQELETQAESFPEGGLGHGVGCQEEVNTWLKDQRRPVWGEYSQDSTSPGPSLSFHPEHP